MKLMFCKQKCVVFGQVSGFPMIKPHSLCTYFIKNNTVLVRPVMFLDAKHGDIIVLGSKTGRHQLLHINVACLIGSR